MSKKLLVAYYTWSNGNTEKIAKQLASACGADLARIDTVAPYPESYDATVEQAQDEVNAGFEPEIKPIGVDVANYDAIAIGTPVWWYTMAPAVKTFIANNDWAGKTIAAFATNAGWLGTTLDDIDEACKGAQIAPSLEVKFDSGGGSWQITPQQEVDAWIEQIKAAL